MGWLVGGYLSKIIFPIWIYPTCRTAIFSIVAGTIGPERNNVVAPNEASLYLIDSDFKPEKKLSPVTNSNGLAWNLQDDTFYYIDTPTLQVAAFDFEPINGTISMQSKWKKKCVAYKIQNSH